MFEKIILPKLPSSEIEKQFYTVLSVELGNTTIKSIILTTNVKTNQNYQINKVVKLTREIRLPKESEIIFGHTIWERPLSKESIEESISEIISGCLNQANLKVSDLDFVVRSTGVVALHSLSDEIGLIIKALSDGCLNAGIKPNQMTAPFSINNIPNHIRQYSFFNSIQFDGSVVSVTSPEKTGIVSNEMESELVTAGIKLASKQSNVDYRNPLISIDMGTTLAGQVVDNSKPYAKVLCNFVGLAGGLPDILLRGCGMIDQNESTIDIENNRLSDGLNIQDIQKNTLKIHEYVDIMEVPDNIHDWGYVYIGDFEDTGMNIIGSKINDENKIIKTFNSIVNNMSDEEILLQIDDICAYAIKRICDETKRLGLLSEGMALGITGRAGITGNKPVLINNYLKKDFNKILFVHDALALGAVMMARCMNSLGTPTNPIGGSKNGYCIMQQRIKKQKKVN